MCSKRVWCNIGFDTVELAHFGSVGLYSEGQSIATSLPMPVLISRIGFGPCTHTAQKVAVVQHGSSQEKCCRVAQVTWILAFRIAIQIVSKFVWACLLNKDEELR